MLDHNAHPVLHTLTDVAALGVITVTWLEHLPAIAAVGAFGWYSIQIWESETVRGWTGRPKKK
jgi:hypothetical protein